MSHDPEYSRRYYHSHREECLAKMKARSVIKSKEIAEYQRDYRKKNKEKLNERWRDRRRILPHVRLKNNLRSRLSAAVGKRKAGRTFDLCGCPACWLEVHLESQFRSGMTWENYGPVWHIDHIRPCASFDLTDPDQQRACFHWTNLQPLFAAENMSKGKACCR